jgi:hypothetical protein
MNPWRNTMNKINGAESMNEQLRNRVETNVSSILLLIPNFTLAKS